MKSHTFISRSEFGILADGTGNSTLCSQSIQAISLPFPHPHQYRLPFPQTAVCHVFQEVLHFQKKNLDVMSSELSLPVNVDGKTTDSHKFKTSNPYVHSKISTESSNPTSSCISISLRNLTFLNPETKRYPLLISFTYSGILQMSESSPETREQEFPQQYPPLSSRHIQSQAAKQSKMLQGGKTSTPMSKIITSTE